VLSLLAPLPASLKGEKAMPDIRIRKAYGDDLETVWIVTVEGFQQGGLVDRSGAGDRTFPTKEEAEAFARELNRGQ